MARARAGHRRRRRLGATGPAERAGTRRHPRLVRGGLPAALPAAGRVPTALRRPGRLQPRPGHAGVAAERLPVQARRGLRPVRGRSADAARLLRGDHVDWVPAPRRRVGCGRRPGRRACRSARPAPSPTTRAATPPCSPLRLGTARRRADRRRAGWTTRSLSEQLRRAAGWSTRRRCASRPRLLFAEVRAIATVGGAPAAGPRDPRRHRPGARLARLRRRRPVPTAPRDDDAAASPCSILRGELTRIVTELRLSIFDLRSEVLASDRPRRGAVRPRPHGRRDDRPDGPPRCSTSRRTGCAPRPRPSCCASPRRRSPTPASTPARSNLWVTCRIDPAAAPSCGSRTTAAGSAAGRADSLRHRDHARARRPARRPRSRRRHATAGVLSSRSRLGATPRHDRGPTATRALDDAVRPESRRRPTRYDDEGGARGHDGAAR